MSFERMLVIGIAVVVATVFLAILGRVIVKRRKGSYFSSKWKEVQKLCANKESWGEAIVSADELLGKALKRKNFKGKNTGERLVAAQKKFSHNEALWNAHKLSSRLAQNSSIKLKKDDVKNSLLSFGRALKDLGVL